MVSNPTWCKNFNDFKHEIIKWINNPDMKGYLDLAIFIDSFAVAGDKELLISLKEFLFNKVQNDLFLAYFAKSTTAFETPTAISSFIGKNNLINIKKAAIFPIVQGIRSLSLKEKIKETTTVKRIKILEDRKIIEKNMAAELIEAFEIVNTLRLKHHLDAINNGKAISNEFNTNNLGKIERDLLKESLKIVSEFKKFISYIFKLDKIY